MEKYDVKFKKKYGQNFLNNEKVIDNIVSVSGVDKESLVIEVGPGGGILTRKLAEQARIVIAYEIDESLKTELNKRISEFDNVEVIYKDFLEADILSDIKKYDYKKIYFVSNVPYYITTPILFKLINSDITFNNIVMMVQKEVGDRLCSAPGSRDYGSISVFLNYHFYPKIEMFVSRENFVPIPNVDSVVISFACKKKKQIKDYKFFEEFVYDSFRHKRKNLKNNLSAYNLEKIQLILEKYGFDLKSRAEDLSVDIFIEIANELCE